MGFRDERKVLSREKRLGTISHYNGIVETLQEELEGTQVKQRIRTFTQIHDDEITYAFRVLSSIRDAAVIVNGGVGCSEYGVAFGCEGASFYSTALTEKDTILGGDEKLREAIERAYSEKHPKAIFIIGTPVVAINNDDVASVISEAESELGIKIIWIYTDGFKSKAASNGYDILTHELLKYLVESEGEKEDFINLISFSENLYDLAAITGVLKDLSIPYNLIPNFSELDDIKRAGRAKASVVLNPAEGEYLATELEDAFGVKYLRTDVPIGTRRIRNFVTKIAELFSVEEAAAVYLERKEAEISAKYKEVFSVKRNVFVDADIFKIAPLIEIVEKTGNEVVALGIPELDPLFKKTVFSLPSSVKKASVVVGKGQFFEKVNVFERTGTDIYIGRDHGTSFAYSEGRRVISLNKRPVFGYEGIEYLTRELLNNKPYETQLSGLYKDSWIKKSSNWYVKQEVK